MHTFSRWLACGLSAWLLAGTTSAQEAPKPEQAETKPAAPDLNEIAGKIKEEGEQRSQVMQTLSTLTNVIGPRLTASPGMKRANEWTKDKLTEWGLANAHLEAWGPFGKGWTLKSFSAQVVEPQCIPLIAYPKAWSPGTPGTVVGDVVYLNAKEEKELEPFKGKIKGAIVLLGSSREVKAWLTAPGERLTDDKLLNMANSPEPAPRQNRPRGNRQAPKPGEAPPPPNFNQIRAKFLIEEGAAMTLEPSFRGDGGTLFVAQASVPGMPGGKRMSAWDVDAPAITPQAVVTIEHYNRLVRMIEQGEKLKLAVDLKVEFQDQDLMGYNTIAEIPGTDLKDEVVMLGGHMDSWHSGTGATDNAAGVSCAMEAVRILQSLKLQPRRTIRIGLWSGEEQGLFGSQAYVKEHFGRFQDKEGEEKTDLISAGGDRALLVKPAYENFSAYFNLDNGTGKIRGVHMEGNEDSRTIFRKWLTPFKDMGANTLTLERTGGTDHMSFDAIGLPGFQFIQDPIEYDTRTHHSNQDVYERIQADDMKQASIIIASFVYNTAVADQKFPRKPMTVPVQPESAEAPKAEASAAGQN